MSLTGGNGSTQRETSPIVTALKTNFTLTVQETTPDFRVQRLVTNSLIHLSCTQKFSSYRTEDTVHVPYTNQSTNTVQESNRFHFENDMKHMSTPFDTCAIFMALEDAVRKLLVGLKPSAVQVTQCILSISSCSFLTNLLNTISCPSQTKITNCSYQELQFSKSVNNTSNNSSAV